MTTFQLKNRLLTITLSVIIVCSCWSVSWAQNKLTPSAQLALTQKKWAKYDLKGNKAKQLDASSSITFVVDVDARDAASTFASIRDAGGTVLSKLGHQAVISIPTGNVDKLAFIKGVKSIDATHQGELKTDVSRVETGVSLIDGTTPGTDVAYTGEGVTIVIIDQGFDFQHPAFKDADGNTRLKCVYMPDNDAGHKFIVEDEEAGTIVYPGSLFDTPELIATLTCDTNLGTHGTHTAGIAAGSRSPQGFGGMAPGADIVLVPLNNNGGKLETAMQFVAHYAQQVDGPVVLSASMNSHNGPHDGTGTVPDLIGYLSQYVIPVFSVGNEGQQGLHVYKAFDEENNSIKAFLPRPTPNYAQDGSIMFVTESLTRGCSRNTLGPNDALSVQIGIVDRNSGEMLWQTEPCVITPSEKVQFEISTDEDESLTQYVSKGGVMISGEVREGKLDLLAAVLGNSDQWRSFVISLSSTSPIEMDLWETKGGFDVLEMEGYTYGDSEISCGDWTTTPNVICVGNYVDNPLNRMFNGGVYDQSAVFTMNDISPTSSSGVSLNGIVQPTVTAPGTFVVSSLNYYLCGEQTAESMQWQGHPYGAMSGSSMSCPTVSGIIALWLQANPTLTLDDVKQLLAATSRNDEFTAINPVKWGYGKIDAAAGLEYIKNTTAINTISSDVPSADSNLWFDVTGRCYNSKPTAPGLYIHNGKKVLITNGI